MKEMLKGKPQGPLERRAKRACVFSFLIGLNRALLCSSSFYTADHERKGI
jgi:hypothetical protein